MHERDCKALVMTRSVGELMQFLDEENCDEEAKSNQEQWDEKREHVNATIREK